MALFILDMLAREEKQTNTQSRDDLSHRRCVSSVHETRFLNATRYSVLLEDVCVCV